MAAAAALLLIAAAPPARERAPDSGVRSFRPLASPAGAGSRLPNLCVAPGGRVLMSWMEPRGVGRLALRLAVLERRSWSEPRTVAEGDSFFANWADFPSVVALEGERLAAHWLWKSAAGTYAYDVRMSFSEDGGRTWGAPIVPHRDGTPTEHGFVSMVPRERGVLGVWLDGRKTAGHDHDAPGPTPEMTLRAAEIGPGGAIAAEAELDGRVCDCCQTAAVATARGLLVAYRDRSAGEVRDMSLARYADGKWSESYPLHEDGWHITACPVNGPSLAATGNRVVAAWYAAPNDSPRVTVAFSSDGGESFGAPRRLDGGDPLGRVQAAMLADGSALVTWLEQSGRDGRVMLRRAWPDGRMAAALEVGRTSAARASGFPRLAVAGSRVLVAWTETGEKPRVRVAEAALRD